MGPSAGVGGDQPRVRLSGSARAAAIGSGLSLLLGAGFFLFSTFVLLGLLKIIPVKIETRTPVALGWVCAIFNLTGLYLLFIGARNALREKRLDGSLQPWLVDRTWNPNYMVDENRGDILKYGLFCFFYWLFMGLFNFLAYSQRSSVLYIFIGLFDLVGLFLAGTIIYMIFRRRKFGESRLLIDRFPYFVGDTLKLSFDGGPQMRNVPNVEVTFRCVEEVWELHGSGRQRGNEIVRYQIYAEKYETSTDEAGHFHLELKSPENLRGTQLVQRPDLGPPTYYELEVKAERPGIDYDAVFLLPIYDRA